MGWIKVSAALAATAFLVAAADPASVVATRQARMKEIGRNFKAINDQLKSGAPDAAQVKTNARTLAKLSGNVAPLFPAGTGPDRVPKTEAKADIWAHGADFRAKSAALAQATQRLATVAEQSADPALLGPAVKDVGASCKACHTSYKTDKH